MKEITNKIQEIATRLFNEDQVDVFLAWEQTGEEYRVKPYFARSAADVSNIVFNEYCIHNLSTSLLKFRDGSDRIGLVVKGCDSRGIVRLLEDLQIKRERLYIVGVPCTGMKDPLAAARNQSGFNNKMQTIDIARKCLDCIQPNPVIYDELIGPENPPLLQGERFAKVKEIENMSADERYQYFEDVLSTCIRCYACRQVCVACDCRTCIFDEMKPQWVGRETNVTDNMMYHIVRASHMAGRCIECGECERVCPVNIPLMLINQKLIKDVNDLFGPYEAGMQYVEGAKPALSRYDEKDPDDFL
ncbi:Alpha-helical ferredoxin [Syntrophomonas zehnderi OL-4]|uniref:Alpha-helical ferredoxin n=1 Tax=Syntrophomonas zehnderi OL-4 TaxID=690567 RepID=A0A0E4C821_9FIRM|nr:4Fe-4S binding protein [Syntrophomonas zehnderi]CFX19130.1 Alpha-helical ferredoxin [Syntrophomonas zehnderi OL-4]